MDDPDHFDLTRPSLQKIAGSGHAFAIPWTNAVQPILGGLESGNIMSTAGPWINSSPFAEKAANDCTMVYESNGGSYMFRDAFSSRSESNSEHLSVSGSISVGPPFLQAEGSGQYDKTVLENSNGIQSSKIASFRIGRVIVDQIPSYSLAALNLLREEDGQLKFRKQFGDFFIQGYCLGADAGICLAAHSHSKDAREHLKVKVTVRVLGLSKSAEHEEGSENYEGSADLSVVGYSTMGGEAEKLQTSSTADHDQRRIRDLATKYTRIVTELESVVRRELRELRLQEGARIQLRSAFGLCRSGIVAQLLLFPYARTKQYIDCIQGNKIEDA